MTETEIDFDIINQSDTCPECGTEAPQRQIDNLEMCERCYLKDKQPIQQKNPRNQSNKDLIKKWEQ